MSTQKLVLLSFGSNFQKTTIFSVILIEKSVRAEPWDSHEETVGGSTS